MRTLAAISTITLAIAFCLAETPTVQADTQIAQFGGDSRSPKRDSRVRNPASLKPAEAQGIYLGLRNKMAGLYAISNYPIAKQYLDWKKYNTAPYISETHGKVNYGPLFIMEKMKKGFNYVSGDWRYIMIMPDGSFMDETNGVDSKRVKYCIGCHLAKEKFDHLYFLTKEFRTKTN
jgi:hypothetical protein